MLIGPLTHIRHEVNGVVGYTVDWSKPGAIERFNAEENEWWSNHVTHLYEDKSSNDHASWF